MTHVDRPVENLTEAQVEEFTQALFAGTPPAEAARGIGIHQKHIGAARLLRDPRVLREIEKAVSGQLRGVLAPQAVATLTDILADKDSSRTIRLAASKTILDRAGHIPPKAPDSISDLGRSIAEKSSAEIREFIAAAELALAEKAKVVVNGKAVVVGTAEVKQKLVRRKASPAPNDTAFDAASAGLLD